jgi:hypothetical protein
MNKLIRQIWVPAALLIFAIPLASTADERAVAPPETKPAEGVLLVPAVQKAQPGTPAEQASPAARQVQPAPRRGIEPDEIDARARPTGSGGRAGNAGAGKASVQEMMVKLKPRQPVRVPANPAAGGPTGIQAPSAGPPKYKVAECGTASSPMVCCHHTAGDGSSCELFKILCTNYGGKAQGDGESAACSDW